jgi:hypothetical protein
MVEVFTRNHDEVDNVSDVNADCVQFSRKMVDEGVAVNNGRYCTVHEGCRGCPAGPWADMFEAIHDWRHSIQALSLGTIILHRCIYEEPDYG